MKALHISNKPVYPLVDGGCVAMSKILQSFTQLSETVDHIAVHTPKHPKLAGAYPSGIDLSLSPEQSFIDTTIRPFAALKALLSGRNYNLQRFHDRAFEQQLLAFVRNRSYDVIVLESVFLASYIPALRTVSDAQLVIRTHNVEHELWEQQAATERSFVKQRYLRSLAASLKREELVLLNRADRIWAITDEDAQRFRELGIRPPIATIPVAMEITSTEPDYACADFFHLGSLNWAPNQRAVQRLVNDLWPKLKTDSTLHIAGSFPEALPLVSQPKIVFHGFVDDVSAFMQTHGTLVTPVTTGSGVRIKLLEALAMGVPCITTPLGATGIHDPEVLLLADTQAEWLEAMRKFAGSEALRREFGEKARRYMEKYHSFAAVNAQLQTSLER